MNSNFSRRHTVVGMGGLAVGAIMPRGRTAQAANIAAPGWLVRTITYVVAFMPGGSRDVMCRTLAQKRMDIFGQPVIVDNKPGAANAVGANFVAKPDGCTLFGSQISRYTINARPLLRFNSVAKLVAGLKKRPHNALLRFIGCAHLSPFGR